MQVHLVDGTYELFRAYYGAPESLAPDGREVGATRGLGRSLLALVQRDQATHVAVAFDHVIESFRNELFPCYKTGDSIEPALHQQFELAERMSSALGFVTWPMVEFEADDALASGAHRFADEPGVEQVVLCTPDKDLTQCVRGRQVVTWDRRREIVLDEAGVEQKFGVRPESIPDWLALVGDSADGIPGIPRWGARSSSAALQAYRHIDAIPENPLTWSFSVRGAKTLAAELNQRREEAALYRRLATLRTDVPLEQLDLEALRWRGPQTDALVGLCAELGDDALAERAAR